MAWSTRVSLFVVLGAAVVTAQAAKQDPAPPAAVPAAPESAGEPVKTPFPLDAFTEFSATMTGSRMGTGGEGHIYRSGDWMRFEGPEGHGYFLTDLTKLETFVVTADHCMKDPHPYFRASPFSAMRPGSTVERSVVGKETLDGHSCQLTEVTVKPSTRGMAGIKMRFWEAEDLQGFPIKIEFMTPGAQHPTILYKNVVLGRQDPTLFLHPTKCGTGPQKGDMKLVPRATPKPPDGATKK